jgi:GNAT superfamily N-acetyltransferase
MPHELRSCRWRDAIMTASLGLTVPLRALSEADNPLDLQPDPRWHSLRISRLDRSHLPAILALRKIVLGTLSDPDEYVCEEDESEFVASHLGADGFTLGILNGEALVAYGMVGFPAASHPDNLGRPLGLPVSELGRVAHLSSCMVLPDWRGRGLQKLLLEKRVAIAGLVKSRTHFIAMTSTYNARSRHNMFAIGFRLRKATLIGPLKRHLFHKASDSASFVDRHRLQLCGVHAFDRHQELTESGWLGVSEETVYGLQYADGTEMSPAAVLLFHPVRTDYA